MFLEHIMSRRKQANPAKLGTFESGEILLFAFFPIKVVRFPMGVRSTWFSMTLKTKRDFTILTLRKSIFLLLFCYYLTIS